MNGFAPTAIGNLAKDPMLMAQGKAVCAPTSRVKNHFLCLDDNDHSGKVAKAIDLDAPRATSTREAEQFRGKAQQRADAWSDRDGQGKRVRTAALQRIRLAAPRIAASVQVMSNAEHRRATISTPE